MSSPLKNIILPDGTEYYFTATVVVDSTLSSTSENPVQNKVIKSALDTKQDASTAINTSNIGSQSVSYATSAGSVDSNNLTNVRFTWSGSVSTTDWFLAHDKTATGTPLFRGISPKNLRTTIGAVSKSGDSMTGILSISANNDTPLRIQGNTSETYLQFTGKDNVNLGYIYSTGSRAGLYYSGSRHHFAYASELSSYLPLSGGTMTGHIHATSEFYLTRADGSGSQSLFWHPSADKLTIATKWGAGADGCALEIMAGDGIWSFCPRSSGQLSCGRPNSKVNAVYANNGSIITSDRNEKKDITEISERYYTLFDCLRPVSYKMLEGTSGRTHIGFIAQDVEDAMNIANISDLEFAGFCKDKKTKRIEEVDENGILKDYGEEIVLDDEGNPEYIYSLRYDEFIALNTMAIKRAEQRINELERRLAEWTK